MRNCYFSESASGALRGGELRIKFVPKYPVLRVLGWYMLSDYTGVARFLCYKQHAGSQVVFPRD